MSCRDSESLSASGPDSSRAWALGRDRSRVSVPGKPLLSFLLLVLCSMGEFYMPRSWVY